MPEPSEKVFTVHGPDRTRRFTGTLEQLKEKWPRKFGEGRLVAVPGAEDTFRWVAGPEAEAPAEAHAKPHAKPHGR